MAKPVIDYSEVSVCCGMKMVTVTDLFGDKETVCSECNCESPSVPKAVYQWKLDLIASAPIFYRKSA